jgi:hypothetical protein
MIPNSEPAYKPRPFFCQACHWILGEKYREPGRRYTQLRVYHSARQPELGLADAEWPVMLIFAMVQINDAVVVCGHCGNLQSWQVSQAALDEMLERRQARLKSSGAVL